MKDREQALNRYEELILRRRDLRAELGRLEAEVRDLRRIVLSELVPPVRRVTTARVSTRGGAQEERYLKAIADWGSPVTTREIATLLSADYNTVFCALRRLEAQGLIRGNRNGPHKTSPIAWAPAVVESNLNGIPQ